MIRYCDNCGERNVSLLICLNCRKVCYCSRKCQRFHWLTIHREPCTFTKQLPKNLYRKASLNLLFSDEELINIDIDLYY